VSVGPSGPAESSVVYLDGPPPSVSEAVVRALEPFGPRWSSHRDCAACLLPRERWLEAFRALRGAGMDFLVDHTAVDYPARRPRFTVVAVVRSLSTQETLIVKTRLEDGEALASLTPLWRSADWAERETYDMFGIPFEGHDDLTRIYMPEDYEGWPMRRDFPLQGHLRYQD
jgi:NADH-quinone oxidoreductase subunit C